MVKLSDHLMDILKFIGHFGKLVPEFEFIYDEAYLNYFIKLGLVQVKDEYVHLTTLGHILILSIPMRNLYD